ncbi:MAG TPA: tetratricopeptide repeat protein [Acidobacteriaceae bacterium]|jgi:tetratricopeptide (TPR) repeat protein
MFLPADLESALHNPLLSPGFLTLLIMGAGIVLVRSGVFFPSHFRLRSKGIDLLLAGKPVEAERCYRTALDLGAKVPESDRVRLLVCLGDALIDQGKYGEARQYLAQALELGDPTGSGQGSMCDVLLAQKASPEKAIEMADEAMQLQGRAVDGQSFGARWATVSKELYEAKTLARKAQALLMLDRRAEARQAMDRALSILDTSKSKLQMARPESSLVGRLILGNRLRRMRELAISGACWQIGLSLLAMGDKDKAMEQFLVVRDTDRMGKYRSLAQKKLDSLGYTNTVARVLA